MVDAPIAGDIAPYLEAQSAFASLSPEHKEDGTKYEKLDSAVYLEITAPSTQLNPDESTGSSSPAAADTVFIPLSRRLTDTDTKATEILEKLDHGQYYRPDDQILRVGWHNLAASPMAPEELGPEQIELIFVSIKSHAISRFLESRTDFKFDTQGLLHIARPFKVLIQNAAAIGDQLKKLESKYG